MTHEITDQMINDAVDRLDTSAIRKAMVALDWRWTSAEDGIPSEYEVRKSARKLCGYVKKYGGMCASGGLKAETYDDGEMQGISIVFELTESIGVTQ